MTHRSRDNEIIPPPAKPIYDPRVHYDENGVDLSLIREMLKLTPTQRVRRMDKARRDALRLMEYGRRHRSQLARMNLPDSETTSR